VRSPLVVPVLLLLSCAWWPGCPGNTKPVMRLPGVPPLAEHKS